MNGDFYHSSGTIEEMSVLLSVLRVTFDFSVMEDLPFDTITGLPKKSNYNIIFTLEIK